MVKALRAADIHEAGPSRHGGVWPSRRYGQPVRIGLSGRYLEKMQEQ